MTLGKVHVGLQDLGVMSKIAQRLLNAVLPDEERHVLLRTGGTRRSSPERHLPWMASHTFRPRMRRRWRRQ